MTVRLGTVPTSTLDDTDNIIFGEGDNIRKAPYGDMKADIIGSGTQTTADQSLKGGINEVNQGLLDIGGYGVVSGGVVFAQSTPNMTVQASECIYKTSTGARKTAAANSSLVITTADTTNPRADIVYINSNGVISYLQGTAASSPIAPSTPSGGTLLYQINVAANATNITNSNLLDERKILASIDQFNVQLSQITNEIEVARGTYDNLGEKLDVYDNEIINLAVINVEKYGAIGDGITDSTTAIQNVIDDNVGKIILIPYSSNPFIATTLNIPSNSHIIINGDLKLKNNTNGQLIQIPSGNSNIVIEGFGTLDGNKANQTANAIACIYGGSNSSTNITINGLTIINARSWGINIIAQQSSIKNCKINYCGNMSFFGPGSKDVIIENCEVSNTSTDDGLGLYGGVTNGIIRNCIAHDCAMNGISVLSDVAQPGSSYNCIIDNCIGYNNKYAGVAISSNGSNFGVHNNLCYGNGSGDSSLAHGGGINISGCSNVNVNNNICYGNNIAAITLYSTLKNIKISNNLIYNELSRGVWCTYATIDELYMLNNIFNDNQTTVTIGDCFNSQSTSTLTNLIIKGNNFGNTVNAAKIYLGTSITSKKIYDNIGYKFPISQPSIPSSGATFSNDTGVICNVYIHGGTINQILIDSNLTGITSGLVRLYPSQTITLNYSSAPSWLWLSE